VVLRAKGMKLTKVAEAPIGHWSQGAAFSPDGKTILVGNMVEKDVQVFSFDGRSLKEVGRIKVDGGPAAVRTAEK
jgi:DNA-binding beta-propeller fold protein YncE